MIAHFALVMVYDSQPVKPLAKRRRIENCAPYACALPSCVSTWPAGMALAWLRETYCSMRRAKRPPRK